MKTKLLTFILFIVPIYSFGQEVSVESLKSQINSIESQARKAFGPWKKSKLYEQAIEKYEQAIEKYEQLLVQKDSVCNVMAESIRYFSAFEPDARNYQFFACNDASIFSQNDIEIDTRKLPKYMQERYTTVSTIRQFAQCIEDMENQAKSAESDKDVAETDRKSYVAIKIKSDIGTANELLYIIDELNMSYLLSEEQNKYYQGLLERLTNILHKYIF